MKNVILLLALSSFFFSCKEKCKTCESYILTNENEAKKKCAFLDYDLTIFEEIYFGEDFGIACNDDERNSVERQLSITTHTLCAGVEYTEKKVIICK